MEPYMPAQLYYNPAWAAYMPAQAAVYLLLNILHI
jgi:hypothetical protein